MLGSRCCGNTTWSSFSWRAKATRNVDFVAANARPGVPGGRSNTTACATHPTTSADCFSFCFNSSRGGGCSPLNHSDPATPPAYPADTWTDWRDFQPSGRTASRANKNQTSTVGAFYCNGYPNQYLDPVQHLVVRESHMITSLLLNIAI